MINKDILRIELDPHGDHWIATIFCIEDPILHLPRSHEIKISNTCCGDLNPASVIYEVEQLLDLNKLNFEHWRHGPDDPIFPNAIARQQGQLYWRATDLL